MPQCEGWTRRGGMFTLGRPIWSQCKNDATVTLTVKQGDEDISSFPACQDCWQEGIEYKTIEVLSAEPLQEKS